MFFFQVRLQTQVSKRYVGTINCFTQIVKQETVSSGNTFDSSRIFAIIMTNWALRFQVNFSSAENLRVDPVRFWFVIYHLDR